MIEYVDATPAKIVLAASDGDSIRRVAQKIDGTYSWVYTWVERLEEIGIIDRENGVHIDSHTVRDGYAQIIASIAQQTPTSISEAYVLPHFADLKFTFTKIDAVYVWTRGGYQIARGGDAYPVFMRIDDTDVEQWQAFFERYDIPTVVGHRDDAVVADTIGSVYYSLYPTPNPAEPEWVEGKPVISLAETVAYMQEYPWNFKPALEMIADEYDIEVDVDNADYVSAP